MLAALIGLLVSVAAWCFLELVHALQVGVYEDLPGKVGYRRSRDNSSGAECLR